MKPVTLQDLLAADPRAPEAFIALQLIGNMLSTFTAACVPLEKLPPTERNVMRSVRYEDQLDPEVLEVLRASTRCVLRLIEKAGQIQPSHQWQKRSLEQLLVRIETKLRE